MRGEGAREVTAVSHRGSGGKASRGASAPHAFGVWPLPGEEGTPRKV